MTMFPKNNPNHAPRARDARRAAYRVLRPKVREETWLRDGRRCRCPCQRLVDLISDNPWQHANIHERTGGADRKYEAVDVSLRSTITLAKECHEKVERGTLNIVVLDEQLGYNGPVHFTGKLANGRVLDAPFLSKPTLTGAWRTPE